MVALIVGEGRWASVVVVGEEGVNGVVGGWRVVDGVVAGVKTGALSLNIGSGVCREVSQAGEFGCGVVVGVVVVLFGWG